MDKIASKLDEASKQLAIKMVQLQKEANDTLIKQRLFFTKKMINLIKPSKDIGVYNAYGKVGK